MAVDGTISAGRYVGVLVVVSSKWKEASALRVVKQLTPTSPPHSRAMPPPPTTPTLYTGALVKNTKTQKKTAFGCTNRSAIFFSLGVCCRKIFFLSQQCPPFLAKNTIHLRQTRINNSCHLDRCYDVLYIPTGPICQAIVRATDARNLTVPLPCTLGDGTKEETAMHACIFPQNEAPPSSASKLVDFR